MKNLKNLLITIPLLALSLNANAQKDSIIKKIFEERTFVRENYLFYSKYPYPPSIKISDDSTSINIGYDLDSDKYVDIDATFKINTWIYSDKEKKKIPITKDKAKIIKLYGDGFIKRVIYDIDDDGILESEAKIFNFEISY